MRYRILLIPLLIVWLYASVLTGLVLQWVGPHADENFRHGIFVPIFVLYVLWQDRRRLTAIAPSPSWAGFPVVVLSMALLVLGVLGADIFLPRVSFLILLAGLVILFQGWKFFRAVLFPWAFLILMIPIPALIINRITFPLQLFVARLSADMLGLIWAVHREGNFITLSTGDLDVAEACSGIRSLLTLITLAVVYGYLMETRKWMRVLLVFLAVPIAVAANCFRVFSVGVLVQFGHKNLAEGAFHKIEGWLVFVVALIMLFAVHHLISLIWKTGPAAPRDIAHFEEPPAAGARVAEGSFRLASVAALMLATAIGLRAASRPPDVKHVGSLALQIGDWMGTDVPIPQKELDILGPGEYLMREYQNKNEIQPGINLYIPFFPSQRAGDTIHSPDHCLVGAGWLPISREKIRLPFKDGSSIPVDRYVVMNSGKQGLVLYWFQAHGRVVASEWEAKYYLISDSIHMNRSDGAMVRLMTDMSNGESADAAQARMMKFGSPLLPLLDGYIPR